MKLKKLRKPSRNEKIYLEEQGLKPKEHLLERKDAESYTFYNVKTGKLLPPMRR